ncbi:hypothetical protein [Streptococcus massiliensis]|uniref:V-type ATP synthase subunit G n=1 Tax=Streptococcus massiliensis TaxID=313439 RepID=A0A380KVW7_9STRE|nr:hypothetical protein [Streptococcus massiliensis]SUN76062.1 Uncharacterised protein [Streptococcus massiliensis]
MTQTTLEMMQEIETAAETVLAEYKAKAEELRQQLRNKLVKETFSYDQETERQVRDYEIQAKQELALLEQELECITRENEEKIQSVLLDKKVDLVQSIVNKVVEEYGS